MVRSQVLLVDAEDRPTGIAGKQEAHRLGLRHRALSVFLVNGAGELLVQRRALGKYHSGGLWANACCSHPLPDEPPHEAALRRLPEELGVTCELRGVGMFSYRAEVGNGLVEDEVVHLFAGIFDGSLTPDPEEVAEWRWLSAGRLFDELKRAEDGFAPWFRLYLGHFGARIYDL